jgi:hypothetical protein
MRELSVNEQYCNHPAWTEGFYDHAHGYERARNPYSHEKGAIPYQAWDQGWCTAEKERNHVAVEA